jgi:hypothetical protein
MTRRPIWLTVPYRKVAEPPKKRKWVDLTDEELREFDIDPVEAKKLIAKLKEKNA